MRPNSQCQERQLLGDDLDRIHRLKDRVISSGQLTEEDLKEFSNIVYRNIFDDSAAQIIKNHMDSLQKIHKLKIGVWMAADTRFHEIKKKSNIIQTYLEYLHQNDLTMQGHFLQLLINESLEGLNGDQSDNENVIYYFLLYLRNSNEDFCKIYIQQLILSDQTAKAKLEKFLDRATREANTEQSEYRQTRLYNLIVTLVSEGVYLKAGEQHATITETRADHASSSVEPAPLTSEQPRRDDASSSVEPAPLTSKQPRHDAPPSNAQTSAVNSVRRLKNRILICNDLDGLCDLYREITLDKSLDKENKQSLQKMIKVLMLEYGYINGETVIQNHTPRDPEWNANAILNKHRSTWGSSTRETKSKEILDLFSKNRSKAREQLNEILSKNKFLKEERGLISVWKQQRIEAISESTPSEATNHQKPTKNRFFKWSFQKESGKKSSSHEIDHTEMEIFECTNLDDLCDRYENLYQDQNNKENKDSLLKLIKTLILEYGYIHGGTEIKHHKRAEQILNNHRGKVHLSKTTSNEILTCIQKRELQKARNKLDKEIDGDHKFLRRRGGEIDKWKKNIQTEFEKEIRNTHGALIQEIFECYTNAAEEMEIYKELILKIDSIMQSQDINESQKPYLLLIAMSLLYLHFSKCGTNITSQQNAIIREAQESIRKSIEVESQEDASCKGVYEDNGSFSYSKIERWLFLKKENNQFLRHYKEEFDRIGSLSFQPKKVQLNEKDLALLHSLNAEVNAGAKVQRPPQAQQGQSRKPVLPKLSPDKTNNRSSLFPSAPKTTVDDEGATSSRAKQPILV